ncbi:MAG: phosphodiester glycosidase family protein [Planctomycetes bacterium]|nr:phosphodiester glycosidase family protein [Planctomycetota bacterium]
MSKLLLLAATFAFFCGGCAQAQPLRVQELIRTTAGGNVRGWMATVDLTDPTVEIVVTDPLPAGSGAEANLVRTDTWQSTTGVTLAINANYFGTVNTTQADIVGLSMSNGTIVSPIRQYLTNPPDPAIIFKNDRTAAIGNISSAQLTNVIDAVAGVGPSNTDSVPGTLLVTDGVNTGATARIDPLNRNPRTAIGINQAGTQLYIIEVDGRITNWSVGMTLPELADLMIERGAYRAINLDGGGSSSFVYQPVPGGTRTLNRPSDGVFRGVANHLGIRVPAPTASLTKRPVRGAWLRPPSTIAQLETNLGMMANAGLTDLYLETFYHGVSTGHTGVFSARFGYDYLAPAIRSAARYGIRVHSWVESGYWQFGSTGAYNFISHPEWQSLNISTNATGGDGTAGQIFANLCNPGVQQKLRDYTAELAAYTGLWGIQTDYHRFALDNNTSDVYPAPWSYDSWTRSAFQAIYGVDPQTSAARTSDSYWYPFLSWRRAGISRAAEQMQAGINSVNPSIDFSGAIFATSMSSSAQIAKCQDWPTWAANNWIDTIVPMAYGSTTGSIQSDINTAKQFNAGKRVVAGLAISGTSGHPAITDQMTAIKAVGIEDFIFFDATVFADTNKQGELQFFLLNQSTVQPGDFNVDGYVDARDRALFATIYQGTPVTVNAANRRYDLNSDNVINAADAALLNRYFAKFRFGEDGIVDQRDIDALRNCLGSTSAVPNVHHLYDLDGDGDVDYNDQVLLHALLTVAVAPDLDVDRNGRVDIFDLYTHSAAPIDVLRDGSIDAADAATLAAAIRATERTDMAANR